VAATLLLLPFACGGIAQRASSASPVPSHQPSIAATPTPAVAVHPESLSAQAYVRASTGIFLGGDDHVSMVVENTGRDIGRLGIGMGVYDDWLEHHTLAMGSAARCEIDAAIKGFDCGEIKSGETAGMVLRATPNDIGRFKFGLRFYDLSSPGMPEVKAPDGGDLMVTFEETVTPIH
jgi:hypothetical protein